MKELDSELEETENPIETQITVNKNDPIIAIKIACYTAPYSEPYSDFIKSLKVYPDFIAKYYAEKQFALYTRYRSMEYSCITVNVSDEGIFEPVQIPKGL